METNTEKFDKELEMVAQQLWQQFMPMMVKNINDHGYHAFLTYINLPKNLVKFVAHQDKNLSKDLIKRGWLLPAIVLGKILERNYQSYDELELSDFLKKIEDDVMQQTYTTVVECGGKDETVN